MKERNMQMITVIVMLLAIVLLCITGCSLIHDYIESGKEPTVTPIPEPTDTPIVIQPVDTPTPKPTPSSPSWGYVSGSARIRVAGISDIIEDKASLFHLSNPYTGAWLNMRYRQGHTGHIYKAAGWEYLGETTPYPVYKKNDRLIAMRAGQICRSHEEMIKLGATLVGHFPKHRFRLIRKI